MLHGVGDGLLGDGVEHHALDRLILQRAFLLQHFQDVPGNRLALAIRVGGENELVRALHGTGDVVQAAGGLRVDLPDHLEVGVRIHRPVLGREVADMTERGDHFVAAAQILIDRLGLRRRLDNDDIHVFPDT